ncbi:Signal peptidase IB [Borrelia miyamotoi]|uniref:Signal peptidase I n=1 Tax=Borrelia miyamotoi TaxID=47466 RepID=A0AAP8YW69_9SPIR|nr:signal peptidase I [Borrelia miyamotoi]ATQ15202.2 signal peptidase I [Borrelia miyamotoi]ATQ16385.2 signal peptidase I [Borrelia miyamotoi]ATQ17528.2 signal peptidase I [Borrelia miyamotoi]ATQ18759.2 signal peptidase I [Borrelia miyamotoi]ATQ20025.2 signal peptidase I [Borrelia miyamotoi]
MKILKLIKQELALITLALLLMLALIKIFLSFHLVKGYSMSPILLEQDWIINNKLAYGIRLNNKDAYIILWNTPKKNEMVLIKDPITQKISVKKIFAIPGEKFIKLEKNVISIHNLNFKIDEKQHLKKLESRYIPKDYYLVIGENRQVSLDSREYGFINMNDIIGKIIYCL